MSSHDAKLKKERAATAKLRDLSIWYFFTAIAHAGELLVKEVYSSDPKIEASVTALIGTLPGNGYSAIRLEFTNGGKTPLTWDFDFTSQDYLFRSSSELSSRYTLSCNAESSATYDLIVPIITSLNSRGRYSETYLNGRMTCSGFSAESVISKNNEISLKHPSVALSDSIALNNASALDSEVGKKFGRGTGTFGGTFSPSSLPADPRGLLGFQFFVATPDDLRNIQPGPAIALRQWITSGGKLIILGPSASDTPSSLDLQTDVQLSQSEYGKGLGKILFHQAADITKIDPASLVSLVDLHTGETTVSRITSDYASGWQLASDFGARSFNPILIILVLLAFAILVGPVNLFVFAKSGKRHRLFVTTPIISVVTSVLLVVLIILQDGFGGKGLRVQHIELGSAGEPYAAITQEQVCRTGILLNTSFDLTDQPHITPVLLPKGDWSRSDYDNTRYTVNPAESGVTAAGDFFQSRSEQAHLVRSIQPNRERLTLVEKGSSPKVTSSFPYVLEKVYYQDENGTFFSAKDISPGAQVTLKAHTGKPFQYLLKTELKPFSNATRNNAQRAANRPGSFVAITSQAPGIETLRSLKWETKTVITGILK